ncbi:MAG: glycogen/starch/alpha-glucan phosphorylase [Oscillospiraceae bacterium]|nr:glycogen/starch/alpha-glucan phosphorylase [Oscillospiraceae bacterium]
MNKKEKLRKTIEEKLSGYFGRTCENAELSHFYKATAALTRDMLSEQRRDFRLLARAKGQKNVYYLCMEFLIGKQLKNNIYNLGIEKELGEIMGELGHSLEALYEIEDDPGLGNGGLGRLAACYMDSLATLGYSATAYSIRYEFGLFKQKLVDGWQVEFPDEWLETGEAFLIPRTDYAVKVNFGGYVEETWKKGKLQIDYKDYQTVEAIPYDLMISGYHSNGAAALRLWRAKSPVSIDVDLFSQGEFVKAIEDTAKLEAISKVLYPADNHSEGKTLRLKQHYFLVSASLQNIIARHLTAYPNLSNLHQKCAIHINDTHPAFAIPELMRILIDEHGYGWDRAWHITTRAMAYTNHTILPEALETWPEALVKTNMPRIYSIICEINRRLCENLWDRYPGDWDKIQRMSVLAFGQVRMANLCIVGGHAINGVAKIHSDILKNDVFKDFYEDSPEKFKNVTNGIAHRRWLSQANPELARLLDDCIGSGYRKDASLLKNFKKFESDESVLGELGKIKRQNKIKLADHVNKTFGYALNTDFVFDVQVKRLHEYKRQLLNVLRIISVYNDLLENPDLDILPIAYIFSAKAAPSYVMAKQIIKLIYCLGEEIKKHPAIKEKLSVAFLEDYSVSLAELVMPAAEVSQQISLAGKEASGTGNMKLMINGAVTIGTMDGANIEILEAAGAENMFIFGMSAKEVEELWASHYSPEDYYAKNEKLMKAMAALNAGFDGVCFEHITKYLLSGEYVSDPFMCLADFESYCEARARLELAYKNPSRWNKMSLSNIASAGGFAADRSILEYAQNIWDVAPL